MTRLMARLILVLACGVLWLPAQSSAQSPPPLRALLITGGCCHDYNHQKKLLTDGISAWANVIWTIADDGSDSRDHEAGIYAKPDWYKGYDVIVHDECFGYVTNVAFVEKIAAAHSRAGIPAVVLHCSIHSYRLSSTDEWRKVLGVSSYAHEKQRTFEVVNLKPAHPIMQGFPAQWTDPEDELYQIKKLWPDCVPLAKGIGVAREEHPCVWINTINGTRVFGTTLGHGNQTIQKEAYLGLVTRGLLWAAGKLDENGKPLPGYGGK